MKKILGIVFIGLLLAGCTTVKPTGGLYKETTLESGKSKIIIWGVRYSNEKRGWRETY